MALIWKTIRLSVAEFLDDKVLRLSAALAYYSIFSLAPLVLIAVSIAGLVFGDDAANGLLDDQLQTVMGTNAASAVQEMAASARKPSDSLFASITGLVLLLIGAG